MYSTCAKQLNVFTKISVTDLLKHVAIKVAKCVVVRACKAPFLDCTSIA